MGLWQFISSATLIGQKRGFRMFIKGLLKIAAMIVTPVVLALLLAWFYGETVSKHLIYFGATLIPVYIMFRIFKLL